MNVRVLSLIVGSLLPLGCGGGDNPVDSGGDNDQTGTPTPIATTITLSPTVLSFSSFGATEQLTPTVRDQNGATMSGASVTWASSASTVASVSSTGLVMAVGDGTATITATSGSASGTASVTVLVPVATTVVLTPTTLNFSSVGETQQLTATVRDQNGATMSGASVTWASSAATVANVSSTGLVTAVADGTATITATSGSATGTASVAVLVPQPSGFVSISTSQHTCALTTSGSAYCWGGGFYGQLGNGTNLDDNYVPVPVSGGLTFSGVNAGYDHTCGLTTSGAAYCWGQNSRGELGDGTTTDRSTPVPVSGGHTFTSVIAGRTHSCGVTTSGAAYCWGDGVLGDGITNATSVTTSPVLVSGGHTFATVDPGGDDAMCGITTSGSLYCWGREVGDGTADIRLTPVRIGGGLTFGSVSTGHHYCAVTTSGAGYCWGGNLNGQLGDGTTTDRNSPVPVVGGLTFSSVISHANAFHTCGVTTSGDAYCWGDNYTGQLGNGTTTDSHVPVPVSGGLTFADLDAGHDHTCGLTPSGVAYCWGRDGDGELGDGPGDSTSSIPVLVVQ